LSRKLPFDRFTRDSSATGRVSLWTGIWGSDRTRKRD